MTMQQYLERAAYRARYHNDWPQSKQAFLEWLEGLETYRLGLSEFLGNLRQLSDEEEAENLSDRLRDEADALGAQLGD